MKKLDLATTVNAVNATLDNVEQMTRKLNSKDNSMGLLLNDRALYDNLNSTADNASKLLLDLRQNPKRYVHFSVQICLFRIIPIKRKNIKYRSLTSIRPLD